MAENITVEDEMLSWTVDLIGCCKQDNYSGLILNLFSFFPTLKKCLPPCFNHPDSGLTCPLPFTRLVEKCVHWSRRLVNPPTVVYLTVSCCRKWLFQTALETQNCLFMHHNYIHVLFQSQAAAFQTILLLPAKIFVSFHCKRVKTRLCSKKYKVCWIICGCY